MSEFSIVGPVKLSNGVEWALHCCVTLSQAETVVPSSRLAHLHDVPTAYLAKHLQSLSRAGIVSSTAGHVGGYALTRPASEITALQIVEAIDGDQPAFRCQEIRQRGPLAVAAGRCSARCAIARAMDAAQAAWRASLGSVTVADLAASIDADSGETALPGVRAWLAEAATG